MTNTADIARRYIAAWNETDAGRRRTLLADLFTEDGAFVDPLLQGDGVNGVSAAMGQVQARFPGFRLTLIGQPDGFADYVRLSWALGPEGGEAPIKGTDFVVLDNGRLKSVTGFFDQLPA